MTAPLDLSPPGRRIPAELQAQLRSMFGSVAGAHYSSSEIKEITNRAGVVVIRSLVVRAKGWSPSLHHCSIEIHHPIDKPGDEFGDEFRATLIGGMEHVVERQRRRATDGLRHGLDEPLPNFQRQIVRIDGVDVERKLEMRHLVVDEAMPIIGTGPLTDRASFVRSLRKGLYDLHQGRLHFGNGYFAGEEHSVFEDGDVRGATLRMRIPGAPAAHIDGRRIHLMDVRLPESVVAQMSGRRVGDVARIHPALDDRTIETAALLDHKTQDGLMVRYLELLMEPRWEPLEPRTEAAS